MSVYIRMCVAAYCDYDHYYLLLDMSNIIQDIEGAKNETNELVVTILLDGQ